MIKFSHLTLALLIPGTALPLLGSSVQAPFTVDITAGTQGAGLNLAYYINPSVRLRLRGAMLSYTCTENWSDSQARLKLHGNNVGLLVDIFPGNGNFYITAGLNFSENKMRCRSRLYRQPGMVTTATVGGIEYSLTEGDMAELQGKYSWNHAQPYIGIGYQANLYGGLHYSIDLGVNFMGSGALTTGSTPNLHFRDPATNQIKPATPHAIEQSIRREGHDFFKIADDLCVYPVVQLGIGTRF